jgi:hypothetical protein
MQACDDVSDSAFAIFDLSTATELALFQAGPVENGIEVRWRFGSPQAVSNVALERADRAEGPWAALPAELRSEGGVTVALDRDPQRGRTYFYRIVATLGGERTVFGPLSATAGVMPTEFALSRPAPNPSSGTTRIDFVVPKECRVKLDVVDLMGREVAVLTEGTYRPGRYQAAWSGSGARGAVPVGVYFIQLKAGGKTFVQRITVAR